MNIPTTAIPSHPFVQKQRFRCRTCGKQFTAVNGILQENGFEANPFTQPAEPQHLFTQLKNAMLRCPNCGGKLDVCLSISATTKNEVIQ
ncbi:hypothetical protein ACFGOO_06340 [Treponema vincentii]|uniref:hypothetical protein n=1 Tax=Treponema vincentii TaxID=69710 RepID=UPI0035F5EFE6